MATYSPTVVKLGGNFKLTSGKQILAKNGTMNSFPLHSSKECYNHIWNRKKPSMVTHLDEEFKNDFKWLVQFKLSSIYLHDIDGPEGETNDFVKAQRTLARDHQLLYTADIRNDEKKFSPSMNPTSCVPGKNVPLSYTEMIENCLCEVGEATVKFIYKWIAQRFPCLSPHDRTWKNAVRQSLAVNPMFKKKKTKNGKSLLWCIHNAEEDIVSYENLTPVMRCDAQPRGFVLRRPNWENTPSAVPIKDFIPTKFSTNGDASLQNVWCTMSKGSGMAETTTHFKQTSAYYELQTSMATELLTDGNNYTEPLEVKCLLDENAASIPLELI